MPNFGSKSIQRLNTLDNGLKLVLKEAIKHIDFSILQGHRGNDEQDELYAEGKSQLKGGQSKHNTYPSQAVDIAPYPYPSNDEKGLNQIYYLAGYIMGLAKQMGVSLRSGADWDMDNDVRDTKFVDAFHFERF